MKRLTKAKLAQLRWDAERAANYRAIGGRGNVRYVFVDPDDLLELLTGYQQTKRVTRRQAR